MTGIFAGTYGLFEPLTRRFRMTGIVQEPPSIGLDKRPRMIPTILPMGHLLQVAFACQNEFIRKIDQGTQPKMVSEPLILLTRRQHATDLLGVPAVEVLDNFRKRELDKLTTFPGSTVPKRVINQRNKAIHICLVTFTLCLRRVA